MTSLRAAKKPVPITATPLCPAWVFRLLLVEGVGSPLAEERARTRPSASVARWCRRCGQPVFEGRAFPDMLVSVDVTPTTPDCELVSQLQGRRSFYRDIHKALHNRKKRIRYYSADQERVYLEHQCGASHPIPNERWRPAEYPEGVIPY